MMGGRKAQKRSGQTVVQRALRYLESQIIEGKLRPNVRIVETEMASRIGSSRGPVREALRILEQDGLVVRHRRGCHVADLDLKAARDLNTIRAVLGGLIARLATSHLTDEELGELQRLQEEMRAADGREDTSTYFRLNLAFHRIINRASRNERLVKILEGTGKQTLRFRYVTLAIPGRLQQSLEGHDRLLETFLRRDALQAEQVAREAIEQGGELLMKYFGAREGRASLSF